MAFFPKEEHVQRRGVAMHILEPLPGQTGNHRDEFVAVESAKISAGAEFLAHAMTKNYGKISKLKTFVRCADAPRAARGNGNVIAHQPDPPKSMPRRLRPLPNARELELLHNTGAERQRWYEQLRMEHCELGFMTKFSQQPQERIHRVVKAPVKQGNVSDFYGFTGLGTEHVERPQGRSKVLIREYNPMHYQFPLGGWSPQKDKGMRVIPEPNYGPRVETVFHYDDGIKLEDVMKKEIRHPHIKAFDVNYPSPQYDIPGFQALGASDIAPPHTGMKHVPPLLSPQQRKLEFSPFVQDAYYEKNKSNWSLGSLPSPISKHKYESLLRSKSIRARSTLR